MVHYSRIAEGEMITAPSRSISLVEGTHIATPIGNISIEMLRAGDIVCTENGPRPIKAIRSQRISGLVYSTDRSNWPIQIAKDTLGQNLPERDLYLHGAQRVLFQSIRIPLMFGEDAVLVEARALSTRNAPLEARGPVTYYQIAFDAEEIIYAEGLPVGSYLPTAEDLNRGTAEDQEALLALYPQLKNDGKVDDCGYMILHDWELRAATA